MTPPSPQPGRSVFEREVWRQSWPPGCGADTHLHAFLPQADADRQALACAHVGILILYKKRLERLQLLLAENGSVAPCAPLRTLAARAGQRRRACALRRQGRGRRRRQSQRPS